MMADTMCAPAFNDFWRGPMTTPHAWITRERRGSAGRASVIMTVLCLGLPGLTIAVLAQPVQPDPKRDPALNDPSLDDDMAGRRSKPLPPAVGPNAAPAAPADGTRADRTPAPVSPVGGMPSTSAGIPKGKFVPEGTFLSGREGAIVRSPGGHYLFVPSAPGAGLERAVPMALLPNQRLSQVASAFDSDPSAHASSVSGQAFVFRGRQYLLLSVFSMASGVGVDASGPAITATSHAPDPQRAAGPGAPSSDPDVKALMEELDSLKSAPRAMDQRVMTPTHNTHAGRTIKDSVIAEGTVIVGRRARLIRSVGGLAATFDNDPNSPNLPTMPLLPCRLLEQLESLASSRGENITIRLSGRATVHDGRNYLLPTMYQVVRTNDVRPMQ